MSQVGKKTLEHRKGAYKNTGFAREDVRKRREDVVIEIRKTKKEESLQKRRQFTSDVMDGEEEKSSSTTTAGVVSPSSSLNLSSVWLCVDIFFDSNLLLLLLLEISTSKTSQRWLLE